MTEHVHILTEVTEILKVSCQARWIERSGPVAWPPWSPDYNLLHNFLWGCTKSSIYQNRVNTTHQLSGDNQCGCSWRKKGNARRSLKPFSRVSPTTGVQAYNRMIHVVCVCRDQPSESSDRML